MLLPPAQLFNKATPPSPSLIRISDLSLGYFSHAFFAPALTSPPAHYNTPLRMLLHWIAGRWSDPSHHDRTRVCSSSTTPTASCIRAASSSLTVATTLHCNVLLLSPLTAGSWTTAWSERSTLDSGDPPRRLSMLPGTRRSGGATASPGALSGGVPGSLPEFSSSSHGSWLSGGGLAGPRLEWLW